MDKRFDALKGEIAIQHQKLKVYLKYADLELKGTKMPDFTTLFGEMNTKKRKRELNEEILAKAQENLWRPITPEDTRKQKKQKIPATPTSPTRLSLRRSKISK
jgi:hypothetical protein